MPTLLCMRKFWVVSMCFQQKCRRGSQGRGVKRGAAVFKEGKGERGVSRKALRVACKRRMLNIDVTCIHAQYFKAQCCSFGNLLTAAGACTRFQWKLQVQLGLASSHLHTPLCQSVLREALSCMHTTVDGDQAAGQLSLRLLALSLESTDMPNSVFPIPAKDLLLSVAQHKSSCTQGSMALLTSPENHLDLR